MVHEKYTKKDGKIYGPYLYENKRVNGKVVTSYLGKGPNFTVRDVGELTVKNHTNKFQIVLVIIGLIAVLGLFFFLYQAISPTGLPLLDIQTSYQEGDVISGSLKLSLEQGELIPKTSIVQINLNNQLKELPLSDLVSEIPISGDFHANNVVLEGSGEGYGSLPGEIIYPELLFQLLIYNINNEAESYAVDGTVKSGEPFLLNLNNNYSASIVEGSVFVNGNALNSDTLTLSISDGIARISTDYSTSEATGEIKTIDIPLNEFNISAESGILNVVITYEGMNIISAEEDIQVSAQIEEIEENISEAPIEENIAEEPNITEISANEEIVPEPDVEEIDIQKNNSNVSTELVEKEFNVNPKIKDARGEIVEAEITFKDNNGNIKLNARSSKSKGLFSANTLRAGNYDVEIIPQNNKIKKIHIKNTEIYIQLNELIKVDDSPESGDFVEVYAIDPTAINFSEASVTVTATGNALYKCAGWNFEEQICEGNWERFKSGLVPGEDYTFTLTPEDPGFGEVIEVTKAMHLDENKSIISDIYEQVKAQDGVWSETINSEEYIEVTFEKSLNSEKDISLYLRTVSGSPRIEVYEIGGMDIIAEFSILNDNEYNKIYLTNLIGEQDSFDLKVLDGSIEIDHIIDPYQGIAVFYDDFETDLTKWNDNGATTWDLTTTQKYAGASSVQASNNNEGNIITDNIDTSDATSINISFWFRDDDLDAADIDLYFFDGTNYDLITESLESGTEDTWQFASFTTLDSQYFKSNFRVRFNANVGPVENFWVDNFIVNKTIFVNAAPNISLVSPANGNITANNSLNFVCNATDDVQLKNITFYWNYSGSFVANETISVNGIYNQTIFPRAGLTNKAIIWNCFACDNSSQCAFAAANWTVTVFVNNPPTQTNPVLISSSGTNTTNENLTIIFQNVYDAEGDSIFNITDWRINGKSMAIVNLPFQSSDNRTKDFTSYSQSVVERNNPVYNTIGGVDGGGYYDFNGADDGIVILYDSSLDIIGEIAIETWISIDSYTNYATIIDKPWTSGVAPYTVYSLTLGSNQNYGVRLSSGGVGTFCESAANSAIPGNWQHVVGVWNGTDIQLYVNGSASGNPCSFAGPIDTNTMNLSLGEYIWLGTTYDLDAKVSNIRIYNRSLTNRQIAKNYNSGSPNYKAIVSEETKLGEVWSSLTAVADKYALGQIYLSNNLTISVISDTIPPSVANLTPIAGTSFYLNQTVIISANVTDASNVSYVYANITYPNGSLTIKPLSSIGGGIYSENFTNLFLDGRYNITIIANDTKNNINNSEKTWFNRIAPGNNTFDVIDPSMMYLNYTSSVISNASGILTIEINISNYKISRILISGYNESSSESVITIQNYTNDSNEFESSFMIDLSRADLISANITINSSGYHLFKCTEFNSSTLSCNDYENYTMIAYGLTSGGIYTITLNKTDPLFGETLQGPENSTDAYIRGGAANTNFGGANNIRIGRTTGANSIRGLIWFNLSYIPSNAVIQSANLSLYFYNIPSGDNTGSRTHNLHRIQQNPARDWGELNATWNSYDGTNSWTSAGGDYNATPSVNATFDSTALNSWVTYNITADVASFVLNNSANYGWLIKDSDESVTNIRRDYRSSEYGTASLRPILEIVYFVDNIPSVSLISPANGSTTSNSFVNFTCNATDDIQLNNITFYWNYSGSFVANGTVNVSGVFNQTAFLRESLFNGNIEWNCLACDNSSHCSFSEANWTVEISYLDNSPPSVTGLATDQALYGINDSALVFATVTDNASVERVFANITDPANQSYLQEMTFVVLTNRYETNFNETSLFGVYSARIIANDSSGNINNSETTSFIITKPNITAEKLASSNPAQIGTNVIYSINISVQKVPGVVPLKFDNIVAITNSSNAKDSPQMVATSSGSLIIIYNENTIPYMESGGNHDIYIARSTDKGGNWTIQKITDEPEHDLFPNVFEDNYGNIIVPYSHVADNASIWGETDIWLINSSDDGLTWSEPYAITDTPAFVEREPIIKQDVNGMYYLIYEAGDGELHMHNTTNFRGAWSNSIQVTNNSYGDVDPDMLILDGTFYFAWAPFNDLINTTNQNIVFAKTTSPLVFNSLDSNKISITDDIFRQYETSFSRDLEGAIYLGWSSTTNVSDNAQGYSAQYNRTFNELFIARSGDNGTSWDIRQVTSNNISDGYPGISQGTNGLYYLSSTIANPQTEAMEIGFGQRNYAPNDAINITISDKIPTNTSLYSIYNGGTLQGEIITWSYPVIYSGEAYLVNFETKINQNVTNGTSITNIANVTYYDSKGNLIETKFLEVNITAIDSIPPGVIIITPPLGTQVNQTIPVWIRANITDYAIVSSALLNISYPDGNSSIISFNYNATSGLYEYYFINTSQVGQYNFNIIANDTTGNLNNTASSYFEAINEKASDPTNLTCNGGPCAGHFSNFIELNCSGSIDPNNDSITYYIETYYRLPYDNKTMLNSTFESGNEGFAYLDDLYGTSNPAQADGNWTTNGNCPSGSCLNAQLNVNNPIANLSYSGGWNGTYNISGFPAEVQISFDYRLRISDSSDQGENISITYRNLSSGGYIQGPLLGGIAGIMGVDQYQIGSVSYTAYLIDGNHSFDAGCKLLADQADENGACWIDNVVIREISTTDTEYKWHFVGMHNRSSTFIWNIYNEKPQPGVDFRCRAKDSGSNLFSGYYTVGANGTIFDDTNPPKWSNNQTSPSSPAVYTKDGLYQFNITWTDNGYVGAVLFEGNFSGAPQNYTSSGKYTYTYFLNLTNLAVGSYYWKSYANDSANNTNYTSTFYFEITKGNPGVELYINESKSDFYANVSFWANITCTANATGNLNITQEGMQIAYGPSPLQNILYYTNISSYLINCSYLGDANYTASSDSSTIYGIEAISPNVTLISPQDNYYNDTGGEVTFSCSVTDNYNLKNISLYITNSTNQSFSISQSKNINGISNSSEWTLNLPSGTYTWNCLAYDYSDNFDWGDSNRSLIINYSNDAPQIIYVSPIANVNPVEAGTVSVTFNVHAYDIDGVGDLNDTSIEANFSRNITVKNTNCNFVNDLNANSANYSCSITMWYFDSAGAWNISVRGKDLSNIYAQNISTSFVYNQLVAIVLNPGEIEFGNLSAGQGNLTAFNPSRLNNTGNAHLNLEINATNLYGESDQSDFVEAGNFSASGISGSGCSGAALSKGSFVGIPNSNLSYGNLSAGFGNVSLYFCIREAPLVPSQRYFAGTNASWVIRAVSA